MLTSVYNTPPALLQEAAQSLFEQSSASFEWVLLDNGSERPEVIETVREIAVDPRVRYLRVERNVGIVRGMRLCLERATGEYAVPMDSDDLLVRDALQVLAQAIADHGAPGFLYSDEDMWVEGTPESPYLRPDWDPVLNVCSSYVFHLCAFRREQALGLGVYSDDGVEWCHDWDTVCRFSAAGEALLHLPAILYHWRRHRQSSTNQRRPRLGSLGSQRQVLQRLIDGQADPELFELRVFPVSRGVPEWWVKRRRVRPEPIQVVLLARSASRAVDSIVELLERADYPFSGIHVVGVGAVPAEAEGRINGTLDELHRRVRTGEPLAARLELWPTAGLTGLVQTINRIGDALTLVYSEDVRPQGDEWPWEALALRAFHRDMALIAGRILDRRRTVLAGAEIFGFDGIVGCPDRGRAKNDPGYFGLALKQRSVSAVHPAFFLADASFLRKALPALPAPATLQFLGAWLGAQAAEQRQRVVFSPMITAVARSGFTAHHRIEPDEQATFLQAYGGLVPDHRWYSPHFGRSGSTAYRLNYGASGGTGGSIGRERASVAP